MTNLPTADRRDLLSIGELARRSGSASSNIRSWEIRHGFPQPVRLAGGHRRYREADVALVAEVLRLREAGLSVRAAIAAATGAATTGATVPGGSFFAHLRARHPELRPQLLSKPTLSMLTSAAEDEYCARAVRPVLFASFQREAFYLQSKTRWRELARTAEHAVVFADFARFRRPTGQPVEVPLPLGSPSGREWTLVCDAPGYSVCLAGWEVPASTGAPGVGRWFETVWTLDPSAVRTASQVGIGLLADADGDPALAEAINGRLSDVRRPASADLQQATGLFARLLSYTQRVGAHRSPPSGPVAATTTVPAARALSQSGPG